MSGARSKEKSRSQRVALRPWKNLGVNGWSMGKFRLIDPKRVALRPWKNLGVNGWSMGKFRLIDPKGI